MIRYDIILIFFGFFKEFVIVMDILKLIDSVRRGLMIIKEENVSFLGNELFEWIIKEGK